MSIVCRQSDFRWLWPLVTNVSIVAQSQETDDYCVIVSNMWKRFELALNWYMNANWDLNAERISDVLWALRTAEPNAENAFTFVSPLIMIRLFIEWYLDDNYRCDSSPIITSIVSNQWSHDFV